MQGGTTYLKLIRNDNFTCRSSKGVEKVVATVIGTVNEKGRSTRDSMACARDRGVDDGGAAGAALSVARGMSIAQDDEHGIGRKPSRMDEQLHDG